METVYLETTVLSYLVAIPAREILIAAHQQTTRDWWNSRKSEFRCYISQVVVDEISDGDPSEIQKRLAIADGLDLLSLTKDSEGLTEQIMKSGVLPPKAIQDAAHLAVAAVHGVDYLLTWNCKHLANAQIAKRISLLCEREGWVLPIICTPEELLEESDNA